MRGATLSFHPNVMGLVGRPAALFSLGTFSFSTPLANVPKAPQGATHLMLVTDYNQAAEESTDQDNTASLPIAALGEGKLRLSSPLIDFGDVTMRKTQDRELRIFNDGWGGSVLKGPWGTVTTAKQAEICLDAGAQFLVSPGLSVPVMQTAASRGVLAIPGALTPTEVMAALEAGAKLIKIFPCGSAGGSKR